MNIAFGVELSFQSVDPYGFKPQEHGGHDTLSNPQVCWNFIHKHNANVVDAMLVIHEVSMNGTRTRKNTGSGSEISGCANVR